MIGNSAREKILSRLYAASSGRESFQTLFPASAHDFSARKPERLKSLLEKAGASVHGAAQGDIAGVFQSIKREHGLKTVCCGMDIWYEAALREAFSDEGEQCIRFERPLEEFRDALFSVDAGIATARAAVAETGSVCLFPDANEPRSLSLVPPTLIVVVRVEAIFNDFRELFASPLWKTQASGNPVFIAGPSKSMAIEGHGAIGAGGPRKLAVVMAY